MDLAYSPEYEQYRTEVRQFLEANRDKSPPPFGRGVGDAKAQDWQKLLSENGYAEKCGEPIPQKTLHIYPKRKCLKFAGIN